MKRTPLLGAGVLVLLSIPAHTQTSPPESKVPSIGCKADGQEGPRKAPALQPKYLSLAPQVAQRLAYFEATDGTGVLAPRGWHCFEAYGSSGEALYVSPDAIGAKEVLSSDWKGFTGNALELSKDIGDTSGRFEVAEVIARVFPEYMKFVRRVIADGIAPATSFPTGPYPDDQLTYKSKDMVEFITPPDSEGLGTRSRLLKNENPISGVAMLTGEEFSLTHLSARLPPELNDLLPTIMQQVELESAKK
jgi:hypothetical protein